VAYGSYARVLLSPILEQLESLSTPEFQGLCPSGEKLITPKSQPLSQNEMFDRIERQKNVSLLEANPDLLWQAVGKASTLVSQLKTGVGCRGRSAGNLKPET
jgi:hypothetical protein